LNSAALVPAPAARKSETDNRDQADFGAQLGAMLSILAPPLPPGVKAAAPTTETDAPGQRGAVNAAAAAITASAGSAQAVASLDQPATLASASAVARFATGLKAGASTPSPSVPQTAQLATLASAQTGAGQAPSPATLAQLDLAAHTSHQTDGLTENSSVQTLSAQNSSLREAPGFVLKAANPSADSPLAAHSRPAPSATEAGSGHANATTHPASASSDAKTNTKTAAMTGGAITASAPPATAATAAMTAKTLAVAAPPLSQQHTSADTPAPAVVSRPAGDNVSAPRIAASAPLQLAREVAPPSEPARATALKIDLADGASARVSVRERAGAVELRIVTDNAPVAQRLQGEVGALRRALDASGLRLHSADVSYQGGGSFRGNGGERSASQPPPRPVAAPGQTVFTVQEVKE